jgi:isoquinoline 1-oxidoreductase beta subunit
MFSAGALVLTVRYSGDPLFAASDLSKQSLADAAALHPSVYLGIETDGTVYIVAHRSEMGTTSRTSLPLIVADELDADWKRVRIEQAIGDARYGSQNTDGSHSVRSFYREMRIAGATARLMLIESAAQEWGVPATECRTDIHVVIHSPTGRKLPYGDLAAAASRLRVPLESELKLKTKDSWRYIGKGTPSCDLEAICTGKPLFGMDAEREGMVYASIAHPPVFGGKVKSYNDSETLRVKGVRETIALESFKPPCGFQPLGGVAVIADNTWAAFQGCKKLNIVWDHGVNVTFNSNDFKKQLQDTSHQPGKVVRNEGDVDAAFEKGGTIIEADYYVPLLAHAAMEPLVAVAEFRDNKVTAWAPTQNPQAVQDIVSKQLGIAKDDVICHVTLLGGGFGRKSKPDYVAEAAILSKRVGRPVKVVWRREDDIKFDYYNAVAAMYMKAALDSKGKPTAWLQRSVFPPIDSIIDENIVYGPARHLQQGWTDIPYNLPSLRIENGPAKAHVRIGWLRSVANIYHAFAIQCFSDELAHATGQDPAAHLLSLIGPNRILDLKDTNYLNYGASYDEYPFDTGRLRGVIELACEKSGWGQRKIPAGSGLGIAAHRSFLSYVATVVEVSVNSQGEVRIPRVDTVVDAGLIVNPDATRAQFEGAMVFGTSIVRSGEITATNGAIDQSNFFDYRVARIGEAPLQTNIHIVDSDAPPAGVGEPGVPTFVAAFCNAVYAATGTRIRELPIGKYNLS